MKTLDTERFERFNHSITKADIRCETCAFNFDGICADGGSPVGYGGTVQNDFTCESWKARFTFFNERLKELGY